MGQRFLQKDFPRSDFTYGWHVHCLVDHVQTRLYKTLFPDAEAMDGQQRWRLLSAAKVIQDRHDLDKFDLQGGIALLNYAEAPAGEDIQLVRAFNRIIRETYKDRDKNHLPRLLQPMDRCGPGCHCGCKSDEPGSKTAVRYKTGSRN